MGKGGSAGGGGGACRLRKGSVMCALVEFAFRMGCFGYEVAYRIFVDAGVCACRHFVELELRTVEWISWEGGCHPKGCWGGGSFLKFWHTIKGWSVQRTLFQSGEVWVIY